MWVWVLIIGLIALAIYLAVILRDVWHAGKRLGKEASKLADKLGDILNQPDRELGPVSNVYTDPERVAAARADRQRISDVRSTARQRRLNKATDRWAHVTDTSFESIDGAAREEARRRVQEARS
ncbi:hypothetical protein [Trueperella bialowiezensis]|uniref:Uncharacterized protein n=1 Tax=Trueperella bialowiezensis TaxID=312285 RepID=A0A3S4VEJ0_9ACTO|nr:hypothetical protein [Trueperella bialowiezensis]VEI12430.1 Uncharacterised protein [Trueperella bialowiezensis]